MKLIRHKISRVGILILIVAVISLALNTPALAADATDDLLAKQSRLVQKWGVKKADDVVSKCCFIAFCDTDRTKKS